MPDLRQSTAATVLIGPFLNSTDGVSLMTAIEVSIGTAVDIFQDATKVDITTSAAGTNAMAHVAGGMYSLAFVASQITACSIFTIEAIFTGCLPVWEKYRVLEEAEYDRVYTSTAATVQQVKVDTTSIAISVTSVLSNYAQASTIIGVAQASTIIGVAQASTLINIQAATTSIAINVASANSNVQLYGASTMIAINSALVNINLWGTSTMIGITSILTNYAQASTIIGVAQASVLSNVQVATTSAAISVSSLLSNVAAVQVGVTSLIVNVAQASVLSSVQIATTSAAISISSLLSNIAAVAVSTTTSIPLAISNLNNISAADVNAQVLDVLNVDTFAEPGQEAPGATVSLVRKIGYLYKQFRNRKTVTSTAINIFADNATTVDQTLTHSDDGTTYDKGEIGSGP